MLIEEGYDGNDNITKKSSQWAPRSKDADLLFFLSFHALIYESSSCKVKNDGLFVIRFSLSKARFNVSSDQCDNCEQSER
jgi:hypothetical protein